MAQDRFPQQKEASMAGGQHGTRNVGGSASDIGTEGDSTQSAREVVLACIHALNAEDFAAARRYTSEDLSFIGVLGSRQGAEAYFKDMEKMQLKYDVEKAFEDGDDVCLLYNLKISGTTIFGCGWYHVENGKIRSLRVIFDPRPVLEKSKPS